MSDLIPHRSPIVPVVATDMTAFEAAFFAGRNQNTLEAYRRGLENFADAVGKDSVSSALRFAFSLSESESHSVLDQWQTRMVEDGLAPSTINQRLSSLLAVYKAAKRSGLVSYTLQLKSRPVRAESDLKELKADAVKDAIAKATRHPNHKQAARDAAILTLLLYRGLRRAEIVGLSLSGFDAAAARLKVTRKGKTQAEILEVNSIVVAALQDWIKQRGEGDGALFVSLSRNSSANEFKPLALSSVNRLLAAYGIKPHAVRHASVAAFYTGNGEDPEATRRFAGHSSLATTQIYLQGLKTDLRAMSENI